MTDGPSKGTPSEDTLSRWEAAPPFTNDVTAETMVFSYAAGCAGVSTSFQRLYVYKPIETVPQSRSVLPAPFRRRLKCHR